jgi:DNA-binding protein WhiA
VTLRAGRGGSFTAEILAELTPHTPPLACCRAAMVEGMALTGEGPGHEVVTTRLVAARAALQALHLNRVPAHVERLASARRATYRVAIARAEDGSPPAAPTDRACCARSLLRGAFLAAGTVAQPDRAPQLEILCRSEAAARRVVDTFAVVGVPATATMRRGRWLAAVRSAEAVGSALSTVGAQSGRLRYEDGRVVRELRAGVNRRLNAETANLRRTVGAGMGQLQAISVLRGDPARWDALPPALREAAILRERHPQDTLERLAQRAACSRSAMADRLRRLMTAAAPLLA